MITIGLFGTCGHSKWRFPFIERFQKLGINFFYPIGLEASGSTNYAEHLTGDQIVLFSITEEDYGFKLLHELESVVEFFAETKDLSRHIVIAINPYLDEELIGKDLQLSLVSEERISFVTSHIRDLQIPNVHMVDSMNEMLEVSIQLYRDVEHK